jgi:hypothetical protein
MNFRLIHILFTILLLLSPQDAFARRRCCRCCQPVSCCAPVVRPTTTAELRAAQFRDPSGLFHSVLKSTDIDVEELNERLEARSLTPELFALRERVQKWDGSDGETFCRTDRRAAKTSYYEGPNHKEFQTFKEFHDWLSQSQRNQDHMEELNISHGSDSDRVAEEEYEITVTAYLCAAGKQSDNDYHLIIGAGPRSTETAKLNVEISGLRPRGGQELRDARHEFDEYCLSKWGGPPGGGYTYLDPPERVKITGSLFFDVDHGPGAVGPRKWQEDFDTSWEIHPIRHFVELGN